MSDPVGWLWVGLFGGSGALMRWGLCRWLTPRGTRIDLGVLASNVLGSLLLGLLLGSGADGAAFSPVALAFGMGFCGALTTWSTPVVATVVPGEGGRTRLATLLLQVALSLAAFALGMLLGGRASALGN